jgi:hypothetical protein
LRAYLDERGYVHRPEGESPTHSRTGGAWSCAQRKSRGAHCAGARC